MRSAWKVGIAVLFVVTAGAAQGQPSASGVLALVEKNFSAVRDYKVDVEVAVNSPQLHMPKGTGTIYFKRPDKFKLEPGDGFMVLPREAFPGNPVDAIRDNFTVSYAGSAKVDNEPVHVLKLVPKTQDAGGAVQLYVEKRRGLILKADSANAGGSDMKSRWTYVRADGKYWMPQQIRVNMSGVMSPQAFDPRDMKTKPPKSGKGTATVKFSNYRINKGISDSVFVEKKGAKPRLRGHVNSR